MDGIFRHIWWSITKLVEEINTWRDEYTSGNHSLNAAHVLYVSQEFLSRAAKIARQVEVFCSQPVDTESEFLTQMQILLPEGPSTLPEKFIQTTADYLLTTGKCSSSQEIADVGGAIRRRIQTILSLQAAVYTLSHAQAVYPPCLQGLQELLQARVKEFAVMYGSFQDVNSSYFPD